MSVSNNSEKDPKPVTPSPKPVTKSSMTWVWVSVVLVVLVGLALFGIQISKIEKAGEQTSLNSENENLGTGTETKQGEEQTAQQSTGEQSTGTAVQGQSLQGSSPAKTVTAPRIPVAVASPTMVAAQKAAQQAAPAMMAKNLRPITARELTGVKRPVVPQVPKAVMDAKREKLFTEQELAEIPPELASEKPEAVGQAILPGGKRIFVVYDTNKRPVKVVEVTKDGQKTIKEIGPDSRVFSITKNNRKVILSYTKKADGTTEVVFKGENGAVVERRIYNDAGLLVESTNENGTPMTYQYIFDRGVPVSYSLVTKEGKVLEQGKVTDSNAFNLNELTFLGTPSTKAYAYEYNNDGTVARIIENKGNDDEVVKELDRSQRLISLKKKKTGVTYKFQYNAQGEIVRIIVVEADGTTKTIEATDPDFALIKNEADLFDPIAFSEMIRAQQMFKEYTDQNLMNTQLDKSLQYKKLPTAQELKGPAQAVPAQVPSRQPAGVSPGATRPAQAPAGARRF